MNYVVLNGIKSTTIQGLLIQSLPPISKPLMRSQIEEIDGRDGDIVTELGYAAYDKEMSIGLYGNYKVDDVIQFFASEGVVIFSNEPDKYYYYQILEQIDFERLIRFKTATVTFHVQPFKYSAVEKPLSTDFQLMDIPDTVMTKNGLTLTAQDGTVTVSGTGTAATEFYLPITPLTLEAGSYTLSAAASGTKASACSIRLIGSVPSNADSFNGTYLALQNDATASMSGTVSASKTFNFLWFYITANTVDFTLNASMESNSAQSLSVINAGNTIAKPVVTIYGSGTINLSLNGAQIFTIELGNEEFITIDSAQMEASKNGILKNRLVSGDYENLVLNIGTNVLSWTGNVTQVVIEKYSRWI